MLRICLPQQWFNMSDPQTEDSLDDSAVITKKTAMPARLIKGSLALLDRVLKPFAVTWVHATRATYFLCFEHLHTFIRR
jgi:hypothetical protein